MAKKKKNVSSISIAMSQLNKYDNKYIGVIKESVKDETNIDEMIGAVAMINAMLVGISINEEKVRQERDKIIEAYNYAEERMMTSEKNHQKILENWFGDYPLLFRMGSTLEFEKHKERIDFEYTLLSDEQKELFKKIMNATWNVREKRRVSLCGNAVEIPRKVPRDELEPYFYGVKDRVQTFLLEENSVLTFALERKEGDVLSALRNVNGKVSVVSPEELAWSYSYDPRTGEVVGAPDGEKYVSFDIDL